MSEVLVVLIAFLVFVAIFIIARKKGETGPAQKVEAAEEVAPATEPPAPEVVALYAEPADAVSPQVVVTEVAAAKAAPKKKSTRAKATGTGKKRAPRKPAAKATAK